MRFHLSFLSLMALFVLAGCGTEGIKTEARYPTGLDRGQTGGDIYAKPDTIFGKQGLFGGEKKGEGSDGETGISVNSFLWRASLDTVSFMPLANADPFGGTILTDWYMPNPDSTERFKINVLILSRQLRSDAVSVRVFKQALKGGNWNDAPVADGTARQLEDSILTRARQLRLAQIGSAE